jgi:hypothetical protein
MRGNTNTILIVVILVILVAGGMWWYTAYGPGAPAEEENGGSLEINFEGNN